MVRTSSGSLFDEPVAALVNPVNCVGTMGKGLAKEFRSRFPEIFEPYRALCGSGGLAPGRPHVVDRGAGNCPQWIVNLPTKRHWRSRSRIEDVEAGVVALADALRENEIPSVAVPALGCGLGELDWDRVHSVLLAHLEPLTGVDVVLFPPR
ncbi:hypothetical protein GCM10022247_17030 [Allokutzneria multivorans]|uniref:Macro domain-containing protein n=1 Tax=Allokutzneria multivorans TaxID=1142134 RepID=A0ABP7RHI7_9PSEU